MIRLPLAHQVHLPSCWVTLPLADFCTTNLDAKKIPAAKATFDGTESSSEELSGDASRVLMALVNSSKETPVLVASKARRRFSL